MLLYILIHRTVLPDYTQADIIGSLIASLLTPFSCLRR
jgi:hypothetical protein